MAKRLSLRPRRNSKSMSLSPRGFTLAELLIVIAIIGVLIAILLPALSAARRAAANAKCLAALKELGQAYQMYAHENKRYFPVVRWRPPTGVIPADDPGISTPKERVWQDFIVKYLHKKESYNDLKQFQNASALWGCPAFNWDVMFDETHPDRKYSTGYGMSRFPVGPYQPAVTAGEGGIPLVVGGLFNVAIIDQSSTPALNGQFFKMEQWGKRSAEKGLIMDSNGFDVHASVTAKWNKAFEDVAGAPNVKVQPASFGADYPYVGSQTGVNMLWADASRHLAPTNDKRKAIKSKGINMLFVDGHAAPVTPREAWNATVGGGVDATN